MMISRRDLLIAGLGAAAVSAIPAVPAFAAFKNIPLCLQMYTVGSYFGKDPEGVMKKVAEMGYKGVEYAGYPRPVKELRKFQDDNGLMCSGTHTGRGGIENLDNLKRTIEDHLTLGAKFIICPGMGNDGIDGWAKAGEAFAKAAEEAAKAGLYVGYHAHQHDFTIVDPATNRSSWEVFADASGDKVLLQIDLGHCVNKGADPYKLIEKYPGRSKTVHLKESDGLIMGDPKGRVDWKRAFELLESVGGVETYTIEYEAGVDRLEASKLSAEAYRKIHG